MNTYGVDLTGRRHTAEFKAAVIEECLKPGVSIAAVALAHSLNANMLRKWVIAAEHKGMTLPPAAAAAAAAEPEPPSMPPPTFIPSALPAPTVDGESRIELQRAGAVS